MNTATTPLAPHNANLPPHLQPLHIALAEMREHFAKNSPGSLSLFDTFEPSVLAYANNPNAITHRDWLAKRWKGFFIGRLDKVLNRIQATCFKPDNKAELKALASELGALLWAFAKHSAGKHPVLTGGGRAIGWVGFHVLAGTLYMASEVIGRDLGDRLHSWWIGG